MIISIDFDGTICEGMYPNIAGVLGDADFYIRKLKEDGHYIIINTCRSGEYLAQAINWLLENNIPFDRINDNNPEVVAQYGGINPRKIWANIYIDNKQVGGLPEWDEIYDFIYEKAKLEKKIKNNV